MRFFSIYLASLLLLVSAGGHAKEAAEASSSDKASVSIRNSLKALDPTIPIESVSETPLKGVYEVVLSGSNVLYATADGQYLFQGDLLKLENGKIDNLTNSVRARANKAELAELSKKNMIIFSPEGEVKGVVYAFTDVDCGYCRKLHTEVGELNRMGIELRYVAFPRGGQRSSAYKKMVSAWCSDDPKQAMNILKSGGSIPEKSCINPVDEQYELGVKMGIRGTPAIFLEDGTSIPGYRPAADIARMMGLLPEQTVTKQ